MGGFKKNAHLEDTAPTSAGSVIPHGDVKNHHLRTSGDVDSTAILSCVAQQLCVDNGQLSRVVGGNTPALGALIGVAPCVVHVQG